MWKYIILLAALFIGLIGGYSFVFWGNIIFSNEIRYVSENSNNVFLDDSDLDSIYVVFQSNINISTAQIVSVCDISYSFKENYRNMYLFELDYSTAFDCKNGSFVLKLDNQIVANAAGQVWFVTSESFTYNMLDYDNNTLVGFISGFTKNIAEKKIYKNYTGKQKIQYFSYLRGQREYLELEYRTKILKELIAWREMKYSSPVPGYSISEHPNKIPNTPRPYRASYTDGIHRWWDIDSPFRSDTVALDDGYIVRIVSGFNDSDFSRIVYDTNISEQQELKNLDVLRGNQVWLKTMKGDVVFYSHLDEVVADLKEWEYVTRGKILGKTGASGVPEAGYNDFHLHFAIMKNPYDFDVAWTYDFGNYMAWDWATKWMSRSEVIKAQKWIFE